MDERRKALRHRTFKAAQIAFKGHGAAIDCKVRNLSAGGACLDIASSIGIPELFDLVFTSDHSVRPCRVIWRKAQQIGIEFQQN
jgi:hypothetical protein